MRLSLIFLMLLLLPVATAVHAWLFCRDNLPALTQEAVRRLQDAGVRDPVVDVRFFDVAVTGEAPDPAAREKALAAIRALAPLRLRPEAARISVAAHLKVKQSGKVLYLHGWLPEDGEKANIIKLLGDLRPDLEINADDLRTAREVRWADGVKLPLTANSAMLKSVIALLRVPAELTVVAKGDAIVLTGLLPDATLKEELVSALSEAAGAREVNPTALKASPHVLPAEFAKKESLAAFVRDFFAAPSPRSFRIGSDGIPHLEGAATRRMESRWLALLRPVTGGVKVDARLSLAPSIYHFPGYVVESKLPAAVLNDLRLMLKGGWLVFEAGSTRLTDEMQAQLASLVPTLLSAGPALELIVGAHPDPAGTENIEQEIGRARAAAVQSFLIDQGAPGKISAVVFDPVPADAPTAPAFSHSVELLIQ